MVAIKNTWHAMPKILAVLLFIEKIELVGSVIWQGKGKIFDMPGLLCSVTHLL